MPMEVGIPRHCTVPIGKEKILRVAEEKRAVPER